MKAGVGHETEYAFLCQLLDVVRVGQASQHDAFFLQLHDEISNAPTGAKVHVPFQILLHRTRVVTKKNRTA